VVDIHGVAEARLRSGGQRYTTNRRAIVAALDQSPHPVSLPQLLSRHRQLAQSSAYRNLAILEVAGVVHRIVTSDGFARFELAQGLTDHHHHHRICATCGSVEDFTLPAAIEASLEQALRRVAKRSDFRADSHQLDLLGVCRSCA
jgi:Fur family ferric uptake transcriptional regulator